MTTAAERQRRKRRRDRAGLAVFAVVEDRAWLHLALHSAGYPGEDSVPALSSRLQSLLADMIRAAKTKA